MELLRSDINMKQVYMADVGDGLCMAINTVFGKTFQIDCGSSDGSNIALDGFDRINYPFGPDVFCLSHFHNDHYNGLLQASINPQRFPKLHIKEVYYPRIPEFREQKEFYESLYAMNLRLFGYETGVMAYDFLRTISRINGIPFDYRPLSKGESIDVDGSLFRVLWPPEKIDSRTLGRIEKALKDFRKALDIDPEMKRLYNYVIEEGVFEEYLKEGGRKEPTEYEPVRREKQKELPEEVFNANKSLRQAANDFSLALSEDNRFLFLGDLESHELKKVIADLTSASQKRFYVLIAPHHGTHWHNYLNKINCIYSLSSTGKKLASHMKSNYKSISRMPFCTYTNGDLIVPVLPTWLRFPAWI